MGELLCTCAGQASVVDGPGIHVRNSYFILLVSPRLFPAGRALSNAILNRLVGDWSVVERQKYFSMVYYNVRQTANHFMVRVQMRSELTVWWL